MADAAWATIVGQPAINPTAPLERTVVVQNTPRERQRVRRACEACRKKKIKCDGEEPCCKCVSCGVTCEYVDHSMASKASDSGDPASLESRVASMERLFEDRVDSMERLLHQLLNRADGNSRRVEPEPTSVPIPRARGSMEMDRGVQGPSHVMIEERIPASPSATSGDQRSRNSQEPFAMRSIERPIEAQAPEAGSTAYACGTGVHYPCYADGFGELVPDVNGILRYVGLGSTTSVVDRCIGVRRHINNGLQKKGFGNGETFSGSQSTPSREHYSPIALTRPDASWPPRRLVGILFDIYDQHLYPVYPVVSASELEVVYDEVLEGNTPNPGQAAVLFAALAAAAPLVDHELDSFKRSDSKYSRENLGPHFFHLANHWSNFTPPVPEELEIHPQDNVVAFALLSIYLAEIGNLAEAWVMNGRAIRLGQDIGLHRSPDRLRFPAQESHRRRLAWWCLYILDRQLSTALGRPLAIDDTDCDVELPVDPTIQPDDDGYELFISLIHLHRILGTILRTINSVRNASDWLDPTKHEEIRTRVKNINLALQRWAKNQVSPQMKRANEGKLLVGRHICLSSYYSAMILLYRGFMPHPHRQSALGGSQALARCAKVAADCLRGSMDFLQNVTRGHYRILHGQNIFVCAILSLQCIRGLDDKPSIDGHLLDVNLALQSLAILESTWKGARKCQGIVNEYLEMTKLMQQGYYSTVVCNFPHLEFRGHASRTTSQVASKGRRREREPGARHAPKDSYPPPKRTKFNPPPMARRTSPQRRPTTNQSEFLDPFGNRASGSDTEIPEKPQSQGHRNPAGQSPAMVPGIESWPVAFDNEASFDDLFGDVIRFSTQELPFESADDPGFSGPYNPYQMSSDTQLWAVDV
ncbi:hypothetical protein PV04_07673 [Phialophora macrospora]|uniref:Zn(2)-C6 fungal-type domain-containing protein n=1 Tax=Phialophora macrospora TaxID=1851006 RepID=A0A0D2FEY6_9EURO|nr:hypothetical protein PV04_07673 [Phialophora macrospora]